MIRRVEIEANECVCDLCSHLWHSLAARPPQECPECGSREWNGKKVKRKPQAKPKIDLSKPVRVRSEYGEAD